MIRSSTILEMLLYCETCKTVTKHVRAGESLICGCGEAVLYLTSGNDARK
jgi:hypothetical protein